MSTFEERARLRAAWPSRMIPLAAEREGCVGGTVSERVAMVWQITLDAWTSTGNAMPSYTRSQMPGMLRRLG